MNLSIPANVGQGLLYNKELFVKEELGQHSNSKEDYNFSHEIYQK